MKIKELTLTKNVNNITMRYLYKLLRTNFNKEYVYGIEIEREDIQGEKIINIEKESVDIISPKKEKVDDILNKLYRNEVSPIHLIDIIGLDVDKAVFDFN
ncbi:MAG: DUF6514 family protein [Clostridium sp.]|nr:DUF6514 family protein [Clostridium sp.]MDY3828145.1 DUF6514 family protein [Clostridium sp.]